MANNYALKELKYKHTNGTVEDVKGLNIDGYQWRKPYDLTVSSIPEGVGTVTIQRTETESNCNQLPQPTPSAPVKMVYSEPITVEDIVLHGDKLSVSATPANEGYNDPEVSFESGVAFGQVINNVNVAVQSGGGKTFYVQYNQGNADNGNNLPAENPQPRVYPNGVSVQTNTLSKADTSIPSYTVTYTRDDWASGGPAADWTQTSFDVTSYQRDGWTTNAAGYNNCEYASGDTIGQGVIGTINLYPNFDTTTVNSGVVVSDNAFERNSIVDTSNGTTLTVNYHQGFATSGTVPSRQTATGSKTTTTTTYTQAGWNDENMDHYEAGEHTEPLTQSLVMTPNWEENTVTSTSPAPSVTVATNNMTKASVQTDGYSVTYKKGSSGLINGFLPGSTEIDAPQSSIAVKDTTSYAASGWTTDSSSPAGGPDLTDKVSNGTIITATSGNKIVNLYPRFIPTTTSGSAVIGENILIKSNILAPSYTVSYEKGVWSDTTGTCPEVQVSSMRTTYSPNGWTATDGSTTRSYADGVTINPLVDDLVLYPCFTSSTTNTGVTTAANCFSKPSSVLGTQTITFEHDGTIGILPLPQSIDNCASYTQSGWSVNNKGTTKTYAAGQSTGALSKDLVLYPYFETSTYTVPPSRWIQLPSASSCLTKPDTPILGTTYAVTLDYSGNYAGNSQANEVITVSPTQSYTVSGWTKTKGGTKDYDDNEGINLTSSFTLYPYIKKASTISQPVIDLSTLIPADRPGYKFLGWSNTVGTTQPLQQLLVTGNTTLYAIWELTDVQVNFVSENAIWSQETLRVPVNTTFAVSGNTITFTPPANSTFTTTSVTCSPALSTSIDATFENNTYGSWDSTDAVKLRITYSTPTITTMVNSGSGNTIGAGGLVVSGVSRLQYPTFTNLLAGTAGTNSTYSGARTWTISGKNWKSQAFSRTFTTNSHDSQYYYNITRNVTSSQLQETTNFKPTVTRSTHTYTVSYPATPTGISEYYIRQIAADGSITTLVTKPTSAGTLTVNYGTQLCVGAIAATGYETPVVTGISSNAAAPTTITSNVTIGITTQQIATEEWQTIFEGSAAMNVKKNNTSATVTLPTSGLTGIWSTNATKVRVTFAISTGSALIGGETYTSTITSNSNFTYNAATNSYSFSVTHSSSKAGTTNYHSVTIKKLTPTTFDYSSSWMNGSVMVTARVTKIELFAPVAQDPEPVTYDLASLNETIVTLPTGQELSLYPLDPAHNSDEVAKVSFSSDFDLVVVANNQQWGTYELWGEYLLSCPVYIYDHGSYEYGDLMDSGLGATPVEVLRNRYTPIAVLSFSGESDSSGDWAVTSVTVDKFKGYI